MVTGRQHGGGRDRARREREHSLVCMHPSLEIKQSIEYRGRGMGSQVYGQPSLRAAIQVAIRAVILAVMQAVIQVVMQAVIQVVIRVVIQVVIQVVIHKVVIQVFRS